MRQIWNATGTGSDKNALGIVLDKSNSISVIFLDRRYDYTDKVLDLLLKNSGSKNQKYQKEIVPLRLRVGTKK